MMMMICVSIYLQRLLVEQGVVEQSLRQQEQVALVAVVELAVLVVVEQVAFAVLVAEVESASLVAVLMVHHSTPVG